MFDWLRKKPVNGSVPTSPVVARYLCRESFWCPRMRSQYVEGHVYNLRQGNDKLEGQMRGWLSQGKFEEVE